MIIDQRRRQLDDVGRGVTRERPSRLPGDRDLARRHRRLSDVHGLHAALAVDEHDAAPVPGVVRHADVNPATGAIGAWSDIHRAPTGDARGSSANALIDEFLGDYDYAFATNDFVVAVWNDARNAADCPRSTHTETMSRTARRQGRPPTRPGRRRNRTARRPSATPTSSAVRTPIQRREAQRTQGALRRSSVRDRRPYARRAIGELGPANEQGRRGESKVRKAFNRSALSRAWPCSSRSAEPELRLPGADVRLTNDCHPLAGCVRRLCQRLQARDRERSHRRDARRVHGLLAWRQNEPAVCAVDPRNTSVPLGSSNDYCGVYNRRHRGGRVSQTGSRLGYYRSLNGGSSRTSSPVPLPGRDIAALCRALAGAHARAPATRDRLGRPRPCVLRLGELRRPGRHREDVRRRVRRASSEPGRSRRRATRPRTACEYCGTTVVAHGSSAPNLLGEFHDKTAIEADRTGGVRATATSTSRGRGSPATAATRASTSRASTDHGVTLRLAAEADHRTRCDDVQVPGYLGHRQRPRLRDVPPDRGLNGQSTDASLHRRSRPTAAATFSAAAAGARRSSRTTRRISDARSRFRRSRSSGRSALRRGGSRGNPTSTATAATSPTRAQSGYTFFRRDTPGAVDGRPARRARTSGIYIVYDAHEAGNRDVDTGTTYGTDRPGVGGQAATFFVRYDGATGGHDRSGRHRRPGGRTPGVPGHLGRRRRPACDLVGQPERSRATASPARSATAPTRTTVPSLDVYASELEQTPARRRTRTDAHHRRRRRIRNCEQFDNRAGAVRGRLPLGDVARELRVQRRGRTGATRCKATDPVSRRRTRTPTTADVHQCRTLELRSRRRRGRSASGAAISARTTAVSTRTSTDDLASGYHGETRFPRVPPR